MRSRIMQSLVAVATCTVLLSSSSARSADEWVSPVVRTRADGVDHLIGKVSRVSILGDSQYRTVQYAISQVPTAPDPWARYQMVAAKDGFFTVQEATSVDLIEGYAYVKMEDAGQENIRWLPQELVIVAFTDPDRYAPAIVAALQRRVPRGASKDFAEKFTEGIRVTAEALDVESLDAESIRPFIRSWTPPAPGEIDALIARMIDFDQLDAATVQDTTIKLVMAASSISDLLSNFMGLLHLPFMLSNRTVGGARGTEIVVYARAIDADNAEVYYFYLHTEHTDQKIEIGAYYHDALSSTEVMMPVPYELDLCHYARIPLVRIMHDGEPKWFMTSQNAITKAPINTSMPNDLQAVVRMAHVDACAAGINPTSPISCGGVNLICP